MWNTCIYQPLLPQNHEKNLLYLLAAGLSGTAFLHAADIVKLDQPDLERGAPIMKALSDRQSIRSFSEKALSQKIYQTCSGRPMASTVRNPANVQPRPP